MKRVISQCLQKGKWTSESKVIDFQTLKLFSKNWKLAHKRFQIYRATASLFSPAKTHANPLVSPVPSSANEPADQLAAVDGSLATASCGSEKKMAIRLLLLQPRIRSGSSRRRR